MTTQAEPPTHSPDCSAVAAEFAGRLKELDPGYLRMLRQFLQMRLGTGAEQPCDAERAHVLGNVVSHRRGAAAPCDGRPRAGSSSASFHN